MEEKQSRLLCENKDLESLIVPDHITDVWCSGNMLKYLEVPNTLKFLDCSNNCIDEIHVRNGDLKCLDYLNVRNNKLKSLPKLPKCMYMLLVAGNPDSMSFLNLNFMFGNDNAVCEGDYFHRIGVGGIGADEFTAYSKEKLLPLELKWIYGEEF